MGKKNALLADLSEDEIARLPSRLRALERDEHTEAWNEAKDARDVAIAAAWAIEDADQRAAALEAAQASWAERKAELLAQKES